jgi:hypothetical protein
MSAFIHGSRQIVTLMSRPTQAERILELVRSKRLMRGVELDRLGIHRMHLKRLVDRGLLVQRSRGVYEAVKPRMSGARGEHPPSGPVPAKHVRRPDQQRLRGDLVVAGQERQVIPPRLGLADPQFLKDKLRHDERVGLVERICWLPFPRVVERNAGTMAAQCHVGKKLSRPPIRCQTEKTFLQRQHFCLPKKATKRCRFLL